MPANHRAIHLALRNRALALVVATTGVTNLEATATGYRRATGSFIAEGFLVGMEVTPAGFPQTAAGIVTGVTATDLQIKNGRAVAADAPGRSLIVGLPAVRLWDNLEAREGGVPVVGGPVSGRPYIASQYVPGAGSQLTGGPTATVDLTGLYVLTWYGLANTGPDAIEASVDALLALYPPTFATTLADGSVLRVQSKDIPMPGQIIPIAGGWAAKTIKVPWILTTRNAA